MKFEKGKAVALTPKQKAEVGIRNSAVGLVQGQICWVTDIDFSEVNVMPVGTPGAPCDRISASGRFTLNRRDAESGDILMPKKGVMFSVEVEDKRDEWGLPTVKTNRFTVK